MTLNGDPTLEIQQKSNTELLQYDDGLAQFMMSLPDPSGWDLYNVRFTAAQACTLSSVSVVGDFPGTAGIRMYIWESDFTYPTTVIDSVDIPDGDLSLIDIYERNITFEEAEDFHIGFTSLSSVPPETLWIYMDDGIQCSEHRSGLYVDGNWQTLAETWGDNYNFMIRAHVRYAPEPSLTITTLSIPGGEAGQPYNEPLAVTGGTPPYIWDISAGSLPDGLTLDSSSGVIAGIPLLADTFIFTVRVCDSDSPALTDVQHLNTVIAPACGDIDGSGSGFVDVADLVYLVDYMYAGGPPPPWPDLADVDGSGGPIDVADLVYLVDYMFNDGPPPSCP